MKITEIAKPQKITILDLFENRAQYNQMMAGLVKISAIDQSGADDYINLLRKHLKRNDRIVWALRWIRSFILMNAYTGMVEAGKSEDPIISSMAKLYRKWTGNDIEDDFLANPHDDTTVKASLATVANYFMDEYHLEHFGFLFDSIAKINEIQWIDQTPSDLVNQIGMLEREWQTSRQQFVKTDPNDQIILSYDNGKYGWVLLDREYCRKEGDAMGHCGNEPSAQPGDQILSFRSIFETEQKPHLTFIVNDGILGEMKGRANNKPNEKYHPYIVDLLKQDFIKSIAGGGHAPESNFSLDDLDERTSEELLDMKPSLGGSVFMLAHNDNEYNPEIGKIMKAEMRVLDPLAFDINSGTIVVETFRDMNEVAEFVYDRNLMDITQYSIFGGTNDVDIFVDLDPDTISQIFNTLPRDVRYDVIDFLENKDVHFPNDPISQSIMKEDDEMYTAFERGAIAGYEAGAELAMEDAVTEWANNNHVTTLSSDLLQLISPPTSRYGTHPSNMKYAIVINAADVLYDLFNRGESIANVGYNWYDILHFETFDVDSSEIDSYFLDRDVAARVTEKIIKEIL